MAKFFFILILFLNKIVLIYAQDSYEVFPIKNYTKVFVLKKQNQSSYIVFPQTLKVVEANWIKHYKKNIFGRHLITSRINIILRLNYESAEIKNTEIEIKSKDTNALFQRPWMAKVKILPTSPWLNENTAISPTQGFPLADIPIGWTLDKKSTLEIQGLDEKLLIGGVLNFYDISSGKDFSISFSVNVPELKVINVVVANTGYYLINFLTFFFLIVIIVSAYYFLIRNKKIVLKNRRAKNL